MNIFSGMRRAKLEGRHLGACPRGYKNKRDEQNKPIIVPEGGIQEKLIRKAFHEFSVGIYNIEELRRKLNQEGLNISSAAFNKLLRNRTYTGYVLVPEFEEQKEKWVKGIHEALVNTETFEKVQDILEGRVRNKKPNKYNTLMDELPLRGLLICPQCNKVLTGSGSRSRTGKRFFYYHCQNGCKERQSAILVNHEMQKLLSQLKISENCSLLIEEIIKEKINKANQNAKSKKAKLESSILEKNNKLKKLQMLLLEDDISKEDYQEMRENLKFEINQYQRELNDLQIELSISPREIKEALAFCQNIDNIYNHAETSKKQSIIGSIFSEKKYRTPIFSQSASLIFKINKAFENSKQRKHTKIDVLSCMVAPKGIEPLPKVPETFVLSIKLRSQFYGRAKVYLSFT